MADIIGFIIIGIVAGWLAGLFMKGRGFGIIGDLIVGVVGAFIGGLVFDLLGIGTGGLIGSLIMATIGAVIFLFIASLFRRSTSHAQV
ncbi:MAG: GlsB/YeaQ/YmgE family stress response membrane protein [Acidobacteriota bacterium]